MCFLLSHRIIWILNDIIALSWAFNIQLFNGHKLRSLQNFCMYDTSIDSITITTKFLFHTFISIYKTTTLCIYTKLSFITSTIYSATLFNYYTAHIILLNYTKDDYKPIKKSSSIILQFFSFYLIIYLFSFFFLFFSLLQFTNWHDMNFQVYIAVILHIKALVSATPIVTFAKSTRTLFFFFFYIFFLFHRFAWPRAAFHSHMHSPTRITSGRSCPTYYYPYVYICVWVWVCVFVACEHVSISTLVCANRNPR